MPLNSNKLKQLRRIGHHLSPVVMISDGLSENIQAEITRALKDHELIKIKVHTSDREAKKAIVESICAAQKAELIQQIGHIALVFKAAGNPNPKLSNILRFKES